jgi:hypothetical protein
MTRQRSKLAKLRHFLHWEFEDDHDRRHHQTPGRGLDRAFDILDFLKEIGQPLRPNDIASGIGSPKSTVYELVASLLERRILEPVGKDGHVYLGRQLYFLGQAHLRHFDLSREADHALQEIVSQTRNRADVPAQRAQIHGGADEGGRAAFPHFLGHRRKRADPVDRIRAPAAGAFERPADHRPDRR